MSSVLTPITGAVRSNLAGLAGKAVRAGTNQIKSIAGLNRTGSNSQLATQSSLSMRRGGTNVLTYPLNVDSDPQQGHYVLFEIEEIDHGKIAKNKNKKGVSDVQRKMELEYGFQEGDFDVKIEGMQEEEIDALLKKYKRLNKYRKSNLFAVKMMDGTEDIISSLIEEAEDLNL